MRDLAVVMPTVDRHPRANYLGATLDNLQRGGVFDSPRLRSFSLVDTGLAVEGVGEWPDRAIVDTAYSVAPSLSRFTVHRAPDRRGGTENVAAALRAGLDALGAAYIVFMEDDIDVCADFLDGVGAWLDRNARADRPVYCFSSDNPAVDSAVRRGLDACDYPVDQFWGNQCQAFRPDVAADLAGYLEAHPLYRHTDGRLDPCSYDLHMHQWAAERGYRHFLASCPSFVSHIGVESYISPTRDWHPQLGSWPGRGWRYQGAAAS